MIHLSQDVQRLLLVTTSNRADHTSAFAWRQSARRAFLRAVPLCKNKRTRVRRGPIGLRMACKCRADLTARTGRTIPFRRWFRQRSRTDPRHNQCSAFQMFSKDSQARRVQVEPGQYLQCVQQIGLLPAVQENSRTLLFEAFQCACSRLAKGQYGF